MKQKFVTRYVEREYPDDKEFTMFLIKSAFFCVFTGPALIILFGFIAANMESIDAFFMKVATKIFGE